MSESQPPIRRDNDPAMGPSAANQMAEYSGNWLLTRTGKLAEKPIKVPKVPMYRQLMIQVCLRLARGACSLGEAWEMFRLFMKKKAQIAESTISGIQKKAAFCMNTSLVAPVTWSVLICESPPNTVHRALIVMMNGTISCTMPRVPPAALIPRAAPFWL